MAHTSSDGLLNSSEDYLSLQDVLHAFNNSINEEQAWAVCYQCAQYFVSNSTQDKFREIYYYGTVAIRFGKDGEILIDITTYNQGSGKGPPRKHLFFIYGMSLNVRKRTFGRAEDSYQPSASAMIRRYCLPEEASSGQTALNLRHSWAHMSKGKRSSFSLSREFKATVSQIDAIQALGSAIYKALDFGLSATEEPHLSPDLEEVIDFMTNPEEDDEGIDQCIFQDIIDMCVKHVSDQDNAGQHYKAVCRALVTEAKQLTTFLDNIVRGQERLSKNSDDDTDGLDELQRSDWARLWVQIMRELRQGVRLRKVEHVQLTPLEYELTPFEILLEDIRLGRYKLNRIMVNGDIPPKVKDDAHAVILDFIRSRPPLKPVKRRELSSPPRKEMDARELLMQDIRKPHQLKHVKQGKLVVGARSSILKLDDVSSDEDSPKPVRKVIKPVADFQVSDEETEDSSVLSEGTDEEGRYHVRAPVMSPLSPVYPTADPGSWKRAVAKDLVSQNSNCRALSRRHTITLCDTDNAFRKVQQTPCMESVISENEENARENFVRGHTTRRPTRLVSYRQHGNKLHENGGIHSNVHHVHETDVTRADSPKMHASAPPARRHSDVFISNQHRVHEPYCDSRNSVCASNSVVNPSRSMSPSRHIPRSVSPCKHAGRAQSPVRMLSRSETFTTSIPQNSRNCVRNETFITARCDSPQTRQMTRSESFPSRRCESPSNPVRSESPCRHSVPSVHSHRNNACEEQSVHDRCSSPCHRIAWSERSVSPCSRSSGNRSRSQSPCRRLSQNESTHITNNSHLNNKAVPVLRHSRGVQRKAIMSEPDNNNVSRNVSVHEKVEKPIPVQRHTYHVSASKSHSSHIQTKDNVSHDNQTDSNKAVPLPRQPRHLSLQENHSEHVQKEQEVTMQTKRTYKQRPGIIRARSKPEIRPSDLVVKSDSFDSESRNQGRERPVSEIDFRHASSSHISRALSERSRSERQLVSASHDETNETEVQKRFAVSESLRSDLGTKHTADSGDYKLNKALSNTVSESKTRRKVIFGPKEDLHWGVIESKPKREVKLSRQSAIRSARKDVTSVSDKDVNVMKDDNQTQSDARSRKVGVPSKPIAGDQALEMKNVKSSQEEMKAQIQHSSNIDPSNKRTEVRTRHRVAFNDTEQKQSIDETDNIRPARVVARSRSEVRPRQEVEQQRPLLNSGLEVRPRSEVRSRSENRPVRGLHYLDRSNNIDKLNKTADLEREGTAVSPEHTPVDEKLVNGEDDGAIGDSSSPFGGLTSAIKGLSQLNVTDLLHVSWKSDCPRKDTNNSSPCSDCRPIPNKWQNPIECLSLTLEEVTHIRMVLTKAELESLITDPELYSMVSKGKICFTCKKTKFSWFGQWSTKCKFCQRNVCNYCLRKMNVPTEHFEKIPVYTLSPVPISKEVLEAIKVYESTGSVPHSPVSQRKKAENSPEDKKEENKEEPASTEDKLAAKRRTLQRSHTIGVGSRPLPNKALLKGPQMSICCDCKTMIMEIIRASRTSVSLINKGRGDPTPSTEAPTPAPQRNSLGVPLRQRVQDDKPRPRSMLDNINWKSFSISRPSADV